VLTPRITARRSVDELERLAPRDLAAALIIEKVCYRVLDLLERSGSAMVKQLMMDADFSNHMTRLQTLAATRTALVSVLDGAARELGIPVWAIKGLCAREWYAQPELRDVGDIDIMVRGVDDAVRLTALVRPHGYTFERKELPWLKGSLDGLTLYGQFNLKAARLYALPNIDIHFGGYSVRHCGLYRVPHPDDGPGLSAYRRHDNILLLVGNAAGDHRVTTKDVNDLLLCLDRDDVSWEHVRAELDGVALLPFFNVMLRQLRAACRLTVPQREQVDRMLAGSRPEWPQPGTSRGWERRWAATTTHAWRLGARHSYRRAFVAALSACRYYWKPLRLSVTGRRGWPAPRFPALNPWTCVRLVPVELVERLLTQSDSAPLGPADLGVGGPARALSSELCIVRSPRGDIVRARIGDFLPTVYYSLDRRLLALVDRRRQSVDSVGHTARAEGRTP
jgi:hypothetical protein